jgi:hypothetical protein
LDFDRIAEYSNFERTTGCFCLTLRSARELSLNTMIEKLYTIDNFSNLAIYRHADFSYEWRPCRIASRQLKEDYWNPINKDIIHDLSHYIYQIEFLHLQNQGKQIF